MRILIEPIGSGKGMDFIKIADAVLDYAEKEAGPHLEDFGERIVENWDEPPYFVSGAEIEGGDLIVSCRPEGPFAKKWIWVSQGVAGRKITAKNKPFLVFPHSSGWTPKTKPAGARASYGGPGTNTGPIVKKKSVNWPGIKPRNFERAWLNWSRFWFSKEVRAVIREATRKLGG